MSGQPPTAERPDRPDPPQDRPVAGVQAPTRTGRLLGLLRKLIDYGKGLASTLQQRNPAAPVAFNARGFGTIDIALILAHITRGLQLAAALEARVLRRVAHQEAGAASPREPAPAVGSAREAAPAAVSAPSPRNPPAAQPADRRAKEADPRLALLPTPEEIAAEVRRRPICAIIADICRDLGIVPANPLWQDVTSALIENGGSLVVLFNDTYSRVSTAVAALIAIAPAESPGMYLRHLPATSGADPP